MDCGSCSEAIVEMVEKRSRHCYIRANRSVSLYDDIFALRGWKTERLWLEAVAKIVHGGKHGVPASDRFDTKLLQTPHI